MRRMNSSAVLLFFVVHLTTSSLAAEIQIDEHTLCPAALHAFDAKDSAFIQDFFQFVQKVSLMSLMHSTTSEGSAQSIRG